ncbi:MAG: hypothetical protein QNK37_27450 [Acidobacteriota bacterium]|nr:hypothetical protein [Acidobacteriota bacterium]
MCLFLSTLLAMLPVSVQDVVLVVNPINETTYLSQNKLQRIYFNKKSRWPGGDRPGLLAVNPFIGMDPLLLAEKHPY